VNTAQRLKFISKNLSIECDSTSNYNIIERIFTILHIFTAAACASNIPEHALAARLSRLFSGRNIDRDKTEDFAGELRLEVNR
jgi:hypothetical protein